MVLLILYDQNAFFCHDRFPFHRRFGLIIARNGCRHKQKGGAQNARASLLFWVEDRNISIVSARIPPGTGFAFVIACAASTPT